MSKQDKAGRFASARLMGEAVMQRLGELAQQGRATASARLFFAHNGALRWRGDLRDARGVEGEGLAAGTVGGGERAYAARASAQPASGGTCRHPFRNSEIYRLF